MLFKTIQIFYCSLSMFRLMVILGDISEITTKQLSTAEVTNFMFRSFQILYKFIMDNEIKLSLSILNNIILIFVKTG